MSSEERDQGPKKCVNPSPVIRVENHPYQVHSEDPEDVTDDMVTIDNMVMVVEPNRMDTNVWYYARYKDRLLCFQWFGGELVIDEVNRYDDDDNAKSAGVGKP